MNKKLSTGLKQFQEKCKKDFIDHVSDVLEHVHKSKLHQAYKRDNGAIPDMRFSVELKSNSLEVLKHFVGFFERAKKKNIVSFFTPVWTHMVENIKQEDDDGKAIQIDVFLDDVTVSYRHYLDKNEDGEVQLFHELVASMNYMIREA